MIVKTASALYSGTGTRFVARTGSGGEVLVTGPHADPDRLGEPAPTVSPE
jgi:hypothetical protein